MVEPIMKKVKGDGVGINKAIWEGTGKPIVCVHGITANCRSWDVLASALTPKHRMLAMDLRGRGRSDKPPSGYSLAHHIQDIMCLMDDLGMEQAVLMGHSLGAFISGYLRDVTGSYMVPFYIYLVSISLSCLFICLAGPGKVRRMVARRAEQDI